MIDKPVIEKVLQATSTMNGIALEGNNFKITQFLSLHGHLVDAMKYIEKLEAQNKRLEIDIEGWREDFQ